MTDASVRIDDWKERDDIAALFYAAVCLEAERIIATTGRVEGAHYAAMRRLLEQRGVLAFAESVAAQSRSER